MYGMREQIRAVAHGIYCLKVYNIITLDKIRRYKTCMHILELLYPHKTTRVLHNLNLHPI